MKTCYVIKEHRAIADLCDYYGKGMYITRINVPVASRGQGVARALLQIILDEADREGVRLYLEIAASDGLDRDQLEAWYERHGFSQDRCMGFFIRRPQSISNRKPITEKAG